MWKAGVACDPARGGACATPRRAHARAERQRLRRGHLGRRRPVKRPEDHQRAEDQHAQPGPQVDVDPCRLVLDVVGAEQAQRDEDEAVDDEQAADDAADVETIRSARGLGLVRGGGGLVGCVGHLRLLGEDDVQDDEHREGHARDVLLRNVGKYFYGKCV